MGDELKVTQADEEATDVLYDLLIDSVAGRYTTISQAFARHRIATETQSQATIDELVGAARDAEKLIEDMARFVGQMALKDYALFNEAPIKLRAAITKAGGQS